MIKREKSFYVVWMVLLLTVVLGLGIYASIKWIFWNKKQIDFSEQTSVFLEGAKDSVGNIFITRSQLEKIEEENELRIAAINEDYEEQIKVLENKIQQQNKQISKLNNEKTQLAKKHQSALNSVRNNAEKSRQRLLADKNKEIQNLENKLTKIEKELNTALAFDPVIKDEKAKEIIEKYQEKNIAAFDINQYNDENTPKELLKALEDVKQDYLNLNYLLAKLLETPYKNSTGTYLSTVKLVAHNAGNKLVLAADKYICDLQNKCLDLEKQIETFQTLSTAPPMENLESETTSSQNEETNIIIDSNEDTVENCTELNEIK